MKNEMKLERITLSGGRRVYTETWIDPERRETLLYVHGGPGNGCWDFRYAAENLSRTYNVISYDQTGVLRSDEIPADFKSELLIDEIEELRIYYKLDKMILCAHSYGGTLAARYALKYPDHPERLIYICPTFHIRSSMRNVYVTCMKDVRCTDTMRKHIEFCLEQDTLNGYIEGIRKIDPDIWGDAYHVTPPPRKIALCNMVPHGMRKLLYKGIDQQTRLFSEKEEIDKNYSLRLSEITVPSLLIVGDKDPICTPAQQTAFLSVGDRNTRTILTDCGHTSFADSHADELIRVIENR